MSEAAKRVLPVANLREFFRDTLHEALCRQHLEVEDHTEHYVVNLLTLFALKPLAAMLGEALEAPPDTPHQHRALQRLGDVSLFIAGFFANSFARKLVDIDYHIAMGGGAYHTLAHCTAHARGRALAGVFGELSRKFQPMVDALNEVSEGNGVRSDADILRLYEIWLKTGSPRCYGKLKSLGVDPTVAGGTVFKH
jgi:hypothetical protein